jgi:SAM-dependent methyltransferase
LAVQAQMLEPFTRQLLLEAGIAPGMRVLDVGSGIGDTAFLAAELVGRSGEVLGTDRAPAPLKLAEQWAAERSLSNVSFQQGDPAELTFDRAFDAVIGRYVLMFQPDPRAMLNALIPHIRPGGVIAFHELEWGCARSFPPVPSWDHCCQLVAATLQATGADPQLGMKLHSLFVGAGLTAPSLRYASIVGADSDHVHLTTDIITTLLPDMVRLGLVADGEIDPDTLSDDVLADVSASGSIVVGRSDIGAWTHVTG